MPDLNTATEVAHWFDAFLKHGSMISVLLSLLFGWGLSIFLSFPIHWNVSKPEQATFYARCVCVVGSFAVTAATWPNEFRWAWAGTMGVMSPLLGLVALWILEKRAPSLHAYLTMKKPKESP
jgi:hypothetical protein